MIRIGRAELARRRAENRRRRARLVGTGAESDVLFGSPWAALYRVGSHPELIGRVAAALPSAAAGPLSAALANADLLDDVDPDGEIVPTRVTGSIEGGDGGPCATWRWR